MTVSRLFPHPVKPLPEGLATAGLITRSSRNRCRRSNSSCSWCSNPQARLVNYHFGFPDQKSHLSRKKLPGSRGEELVVIGLQLCILLDRYYSFRPSSFPHAKYSKDRIAKFSDHHYTKPYNLSGGSTQQHVLCPPRSSVRPGVFHSTNQWLSVALAVRILPSRRSPVKTKSAAAH